MGQIVSTGSTSCFCAVLGNGNLGISKLDNLILFGNSGLEIFTLGTFTSVTLERTDFTLGNDFPFFAILKPRTIPPVMAAIARIQVIIQYIAGNDKLKSSLIVPNTTW